MRTAVFITLGFFLTRALAQEVQTPVNEKNEEAAKAHVTIIALGPIAKRRYLTPKQGEKDREVVAQLLPERKGESPPSTLYYRHRKNGKKYEKMRIGFNNPATISKLKPKKIYSLYLRDEESDGEYKNYLTIPALAPNSQTLILLTQPSEKSDRWLNKPERNLIDLNSEALKDSNLYMKNLSSEVVFLKIGDDPETALKPGAGAVYSGKAGEQIVGLLAAKGTNASTPLIRTGIRIPEGNLTVFAFYNADPATNSGKSVGVCRVVTNRLKFPEPELK